MKLQFSLAQLFVWVTFAAAVCWFVIYFLPPKIPGLIKFWNYVL